MRTTTSTQQVSAAALTAGEVDALRARLTAAALPVEDAERIDLLRSYEELKAAAAAIQVRLTAEFDASQRAGQASAGVRAERQARGIASQIALARKDSPARGSRHVGLARVLVREMPHTLAALSSGAISEWRATLLARETAVLSAEDRAVVDAALCSDVRRLDGLGDRRLVGEARRLAHRLDPGAAVRRCRAAEGDRRVTIRPMPDTMAQVTALLPVGQGVAVYAALKRQADSLTATGDDRGRGQLMADTLVERVTGQATAEAVPVAVGLVMTDRSLLAGPVDGDGVHEPAQLDGFGPVPAGIARDLVRRALEQAGTAAASWLRRLYAEPTTGELVAMDSRARSFPDGLQRLIHHRDAGLCRTPWCGAPIRHHDHVVPVEEAGQTSAANGQGLCVQCNHAKQAPGWEAVPRPGPRHTVVVRTPTGHTYRSTAPPLPGCAPGRARPDLSWLEERLLILVRAA